MKLSDWASIAEITSGIAVVVTLVVLINGIAENTAVTRSSMTATALRDFSDMERTIMADSDLSRLYSAHIFGQFDGLDEHERNRQALIVSNLFRSYDMAFIMGADDLIEPTVLGGSSQVVCNHFQRAMEAGRSWILDTVSDGFADFLTSNC